MFLSRRSNGIYYLWFDDELGRKQKVSTGTRRKSEAVSFLRSFRRDVHQRLAKQRDLRLSEFIRSYLAHSATVHTPKTVESNLTAFDQFQKFIGDLPLQRIGVREIETFLAKKKSDASEWTARKYYLALASAFQTACRWGHLSSNPFRQVEKPKTPELVPTFFTRGDFNALLEGIPSRDFRELVVCAVSTGMRRGELLALRWPQVDLPRRVITVTSCTGFTTKNRRVRVIPMTEGVWQILRERKERSSGVPDLVFHADGERISGDRLSKMLKAAIRRANLPDNLHLHSLRHTFATWLVQSGASIYEVQKLLGHSTISTTQVYAHLTASELRGAMDGIKLDLSHVMIHSGKSQSGSCCRAGSPARLPPAQ